MAWGRRCSIGCETWPDKLIYKTCPECGESTVRFSNLKPIPDAEGESVLRQRAFARYYEKWCADRQQSVDGPLHMTPVDGLEASCVT